MTNREKRRKKLARKARKLAGMENNQKKVRVKKTGPTPKNNQKANERRRLARRIGTSRAWKAFRLIMRRLLSRKGL